MLSTRNLQPTQDTFFDELPLFPDEQDIFQQPPGSSDTTASGTPVLADEYPLQTVQPHEMHVSSPSSSLFSSGGLRSPVDPHEHIACSPSSYLPAERRETLRRLSLATSDFDAGDAYRPRNTPNRPRRSSSIRIKPRDEKHARELELNRKAATKCRNRQKAFVENLQERYRKEERKLYFQTSLVHALHDEVVALRNEVMRQSFCDCRYIQQAIAPNAP